MATSKLMSHVRKLVNVLRVKWIQIISLNYNSCNRRLQGNIIYIVEKIKLTNLSWKSNITLARI